MNLFWAEIEYLSHIYKKKIPAQNSSKHQKSLKNIQNHWNFLAWSFGANRIDLRFETSNMSEKKKKTNIEQ